MTTSRLPHAIKPVAGVGTLLTFPTLIWLGRDSVTANAPSTLAICLGELTDRDALPLLRQHGR